MNHDEILRTLSRVFEEVFGHAVELHDHTTAADVEGWDSIVHVMLILAIEDELGIKFESAEIANAADVGEFVRLVESKQR